MVIAGLFLIYIRNLCDNMINLKGFADIHTLRNGKLESREGKDSRCHAVTP